MDRCIFTRPTPVSKRSRKGKWEQSRFPLCQIISCLSSWPHFFIGVINSRELESVSPPPCLCPGLRERERKRDRPLGPCGDPISAHPGPPEPAQDSAPSHPLSWIRNVQSWEGSGSWGHTLHPSASRVQSLSSLHSLTPPPLPTA